jgi:hypothetical protein
MDDSPTAIRFSCLVHSLGDGSLPIQISQFSRSRTLESSQTRLSCCLRCTRWAHTGWAVDDVRRAARLRLWATAWQPPLGVSGVSGGSTVVVVQTVVLQTVITSRPRAQPLDPPRPQERRHSSGTPAAHRSDQSAIHSLVVQREVINERQQQRHDLCAHVCVVIRLLLFRVLRLFRVLGCSGLIRQH